MPDYNKLPGLPLLVSFETFETCGAVAALSVVEIVPESEDCDSLQIFSAVYCDCPTLPKKYQSACSLCEPGETLSNSLETVFTDPDGASYSCRGLNSAVEYAGSNDPTCESGAFIVEALENSTPNGRATCCTPKNPKQGKTKKGGKAAAKGDAGPAVSEVLKKIKMSKKL
jgi:hypothetical protein